jgi:hypothetical protein
MPKPLMNSTMTAEPCTTCTRRKFGEMPQQRAVAQGADANAEQQHDAQHADHARAEFFRRDVGGQRQPGGLHRVHAGTHQQEGQGGGDGPTKCGAWLSPERTMSANGMMARPPHCAMSAEPQIGQALPAESRAMLIRLEADHGAQPARKPAAARS